MVRNARREKMRKYVFIAAGGALGALLRHWLMESDLQNIWTPIISGTLFENLIGCFALAFFLTISLEILHLSVHLRLGIATGTLGAFTTFSGMCHEIATMALDGWYGSAVAYLLLSAAGGLGATYLGVVLAREIARKKSKAKSGADAWESGTE